MAKIISEKTEVDFFNSILERIGVDKIYFENNLIFVKPKKENFLLLFQLEFKLKSLLNLIFDNISNDENLQKRITFLTNAISMTDWTQINPEAEIYLSKIFPIKVDQLDYDLIINRDQMPFKLLKAEYNSIFFSVNQNILLIKKQFDSKLEGFSFSVIRGFQYL